MKPLEGDSQNAQPLLQAEHDHPKRQGTRVTFSGFEYLLPSNVKRGEIAVVLKRMSGFFNPGEMTAVMGPSGCGKSILMDVLSGRRTTGTIKGTIRYGSQEPTKGFLRHCSGYVEQFSSLIENLTVFEMLMYTAELKRPLNESKISKKRAVEDLIDRMALTTCKDMKIGNPHLDRGISGGEGKRVNIGIALITNPKVLYMDEPVSGLDSYTANEVMEVIRTLVFDGTTLCATLHSPTPFTFGLFDRILLLVQGNMVFFGERSKVVAYFESLHVGSFHQSQSVAEWLTEIIVKADQEDTTPVLISGYEESSLPQETEALLEAELKQTEQEETVDSAEQFAQTSTPFWFSLGVLLRYRSMKNLMSPSFWLTRTLDKTVIVILLCTIYEGLGDKFTLRNAQNMSALMFIWTTFSATGALVYVPHLVMERWVFYREQRDGLYPVLAYFLTKILEEYFVAAILCVTYSTILWFIIDLQGSIVRFMLTFYGMFASSIVLALFFGAIAPNMDVANALFPCYMMTLMFYGGFLLLPNNIPDYLVWYSDIDFLKYSYGSLMVNQFRHNVTPRTPSPDFLAPTYYLEVVGLGNVEGDQYIGILFIFVAVFAVLAYVAMVYVRYDRKR